MSKHINSIENPAEHSALWYCDIIMRLERGIKDALMHLETNYDIDGNSMKDSDAARTLRSAISPANSEPSAR